MDPPAKINFRPEVDKLDRRMAGMTVEEKTRESYDSGVAFSSMMDAESDSGSMSHMSVPFDGQTRLRKKPESLVEYDEPSLGYGSYEPSIEPSDSRCPDRPELQTHVEVAPPTTVQEDSRQDDQSPALPPNNLFSNVLRQAMRDPAAMKPQDTGDLISEQEPVVATQADSQLPRVSDGPFLSNSYLHNYACCGDGKYLLAPYRAVLAEQNEDGDSSLHLAIINAQVPVVEQITAVWQGVPQFLNVQNKRGQTGMHLAIITGQPRVVERLLTAGADPCRRDRNGDTCLHMAARYGDKLSASLILSVCQRYNCRRDSLEIRNYDGFTAAHLCVLKNQRDMLKFFVQTWGADVDAQDYTAGRSPLHLAVENGLLGIASMLAFELEATIDAPMYDKQTALHIAAGRENRGMVAVLVAAGAQTDVTDGEGEQPADLTYDTQILRLCNA